MLRISKYLDQFTYEQIRQFFTKFDFANHLVNIMAQLLSTMLKLNDNFFQDLNEKSANLAKGIKTERPKPMNRECCSTVYQSILDK